jgi:hypothetical protein
MSIRNHPDPISRELTRMKQFDMHGTETGKKETRYGAGLTNLGVSGGGEKQVCP